MATMKNAKGRYPSQEDDDVPADIRAADESLSNSDDGGEGLSEDYSADKSEQAEPLEVEAESVKKNPPLEESKTTSSPMADQDKASFARAITGATPALMGLLMGASPAMAESQIKEGQAYYSSGTTKKTVLTMGPDGKPVYTDVRDSIGKQAYTKPSTAGQQQRLLQSRRMVDLDKINDPNAKPEEKYKMVRDTLDGPVDAMSGESLKGRRMIEAGTDQILRLPTPGGGVNYESYNKILDKKKPVAGALGPGEVMGPSGKPLLKQEAESVIRTAEKGKELGAALEKEGSAISADRRTVETTTDPTVFATTIGKALRTVESRLDEREQKRFMGDDYKGFMLRGEEYLKSKYGGQIPETVRRNFLNLLDAAKERVEFEKTANLKSYGTVEGLSKRGQEAVNRVLGKSNEPAQPNIPSHIINMSREDKIKKYNELKAQGRIK